MSKKNVQRRGRILLTASIISGIQWSAAAALGTIAIATPAKAQQVGTIECGIATAPIPVTATLNPDLSIDKSSLPRNRAISSGLPAAGDPLCQSASDIGGEASACQILLPGDAIGPSSWTARRSGSSSGEYLQIMPYAGQASPVKSEFEVGEGFLGPSGGFYMWVRFSEPSTEPVPSGQYIGEVPFIAVVYDTTLGWSVANYCNNIDADPYYAVSGSFTHTFVIDVPEACSSTIPNELNFGQIANTASARNADAQVVTRCNSDDLMYNIYITGGTGTSNDSLTMTDGASGNLTYGLYMDEARTTAFQRAPMGANVDQDGPYIRSFDGHTATIYGQVPAQPLPQAGAYSDTVTVHVEY